MAERQETVRETKPNRNSNRKFTELPHELAEIQDSIIIKATYKPNEGNKIGVQKDQVAQEMSGDGGLNQDVHTQGADDMQFHLPIPCIRIEDTDGTKSSHPNRASSLYHKRKSVPIENRRRSSQHKYQPYRMRRIGPIFYPNHVAQRPRLRLSLGRRSHVASMERYKMGSYQHGKQPASRHGAPFRPYCGHQSVLRENHNYSSIQDERQSVSMYDHPLSPNYGTQSTVTESYRMSSSYVENQVISKENYDRHPSYYGDQSVSMENYDMGSFVCVNQPTSTDSCSLSSFCYENQSQPGENCDMYSDNHESLPPFTNTPFLHHKNSSESVKNYDMGSPRCKNGSISMESYNKSSPYGLDKSASMMNNETNSFHKNQFKAMKNHDMCSSPNGNHSLPLENFNMKPTKYINQHITMENLGTAALIYGSHAVSMQNDARTEFSQGNKQNGMIPIDMVHTSYGYAAFPTQYFDSSLLEPENSYEFAIKHLNNLLLMQPVARLVIFVNLNMHLVTKRKKLDMGRFPIKKIQEWRLELGSTFEAFQADSQKELQASGITNYANTAYVVLSVKILPNSIPGGPDGKRELPPFELDGLHQEFLEEYWGCYLDWLAGLSEDRLQRETPTIKITFRREEQETEVNESDTEENSSTKPKMSFQASNQSPRGKMRAALGTGNFIEFNSGRQGHFTTAQIDIINKNWSNRAYEAEMIWIRARFEAARSFDESDDQEFIPNYAD